MTRISDFLRNSRGVATIEFAFTSIMLFVTIMVALDFGFFAQQKLKLGSAVEQGAIIAYNQQAGVTVAQIGNYVSAAASLKGTTNVTITCNGTSTCGDGKCSCISTTGTFVSLGTCNTACQGSQAISGNYMKIAATSTYNSVIVPDKWLGGKSITSNAVVRLQ